MVSWEATDSCHSCVNQMVAKARSFRSFNIAGLKRDKIGIRNRNNMLSLAKLYRQEFVLGTRLCCFREVYERG